MTHVQTRPAANRTAGHWMGPARLMLRTRKARRAKDPGAVLRAVARGKQGAVGIRIRGRHILLLLDPDLAGDLLAGHAADTTKGPGVQLTRALLGNGLLTSEGDDHRRARRLVAPAFSPRRLAGYTETFAASTQAHTAGWSGGEQFDIHREMATLTLSIVGRTLLGIDLSAEAPQVRAGLESALERFGGNGANGLAFTGGRRRIGRRKPIAATDALLGADDPARAAVHELVDRIIEQRRTTATADRGDVVSALLAASEEPDGLTPAEVHDQVITLLMAGHETTANALSWTLYLLGSHPEVQQRLQAEVDGLGGRLPTFDDIPRLTFTRAVISEGIRHYPPAWIMGRTTVTDLEIGGWQVPAGSVVATSPLLLHHDARWFPSPETFDPDRWLDSRREAVPKNGYLPFGTGPRSCIGEQFAWTEAITVLAVLAQSWTFRGVPDRPVIPQYRVTLRPGNGIAMTVAARTQATIRASSAAHP